MILLYGVSGFLNLLPDTSQSLADSSSLCAPINIGVLRNSSEALLLRTSEFMLLIQEESARIDRLFACHALPFEFRQSQPTGFVLNRFLGLCEATNPR